MMLRVLKEKFFRLGHDEDGAALVITLAMFFLMYLGCMGVYAISMAVKERIHLQNAADAAAYSAAVVQADTLSRIATINRAMSWTYVDMTRHQMDYIVRRWLGHTCDHYERDMNGGTDEKGHKRDSLSDYNKNSVLYKPVHVYLSPFGPNAPCSAHRSFGVGYYIGADDVSPLMVHLNGRDPSKYRMPRNAGNVRLPSISSGHNELEALVRAKLVVNDAEYVLKYASIIPRLTACLPNDLEAIVKLTYDCLADLSPSVMTRLVLLDNLAQAQNIDLSVGGDIGVPLLMKNQINIDKFAIAKMNVCERYLALDLPNRVEACVKDVLDANLASFPPNAIMYTVQQFKALGDELAGQLPSYLMSFNHDMGYLRDIFNTETDENTFLSFSDYPNIYDTFETGINQWFVRGNGAHRTDGEYGIQRCYKHMTKSWIAHDKSINAGEPLSKFHATHSPLEPTSWNTKKLESADASCALFSEWMWWSDTWYCFRIWIPYPPGYITIHLNLPHYQEIWPSKPSCPHHSKPGLLGLKSGELTMPDWSSFFSVGSLTSAAKSHCIKKRKWRPPKFRSHDYTPNIDFGLRPLINKLASIDNLLGNYEPIEEYHDGCFIWPDLLSPRGSICKFTGYSRLYADDPHLYNKSYVGVKAMPLVLDSSYFGKAGTISVGIRRQNENVFVRFLNSIEGIFTAFDPDWNGVGEATHTYVFASAKAGYKDKGEAASSLAYKIDWQPGNQKWNLCQSDWDAVFVPVRKAYSDAISGFWLDGGDEMLEDWVQRDTDMWKPLGSGNEGDYTCRNIDAPRGMLLGNGHDGTLKWRELSHVMFH